MRRGNIRTVMSNKDRDIARESSFRITVHFNAKNRAGILGYLQSFAAVAGLKLIAHHRFFFAGDFNLN